jgi:hypothetical protein
MLALLDYVVRDYKYTNALVSAIAVLEINAKCR